MMRRIALAPGIVAVVAVVAFSAGPAAAKSGGPAPSTASLVVSSVSGGSSSAPAYGGDVALTATFASMKQVPEVSVQCTSNGQDVYLEAQTSSGGNSPWTSTFLMSSPEWTNAGGGAATCSANLYYYVWQGKTETGVVYLAHTAFTVS